MSPKNSILFGPFRLDRENQCLWRAEQELRLPPKAFTVLRYLAEHPGRLVSKGELLDAGWADTAVSEGVLKFCIREIRQVLGDQPRAPQFIETVHRRGYRFIAPITTSVPPISHPGSYVQPLTPTLVGREAELERLQGWLEKALRGERQVVFVTGEAGIGKTTVVQAFVQRVNTNGELWIGQGQCIEHYGAGEAICRYWRPGDGCVGNLKGSISWSCLASMRQAGWYSYPG